MCYTIYGDKFSMTFFEKSIDKWGNLCYNDQAVNERAQNTPEQRTILENDTENNEQEAKQSIREN